LLCACLMLAALSKLTTKSKRALADGRVIWSALIGTQTDREHSRLLGKFSTP
jgi:hypothetical protein